MHTYMQLFCVGITRYPRAVWDMETSIYQWNDDGYHVFPPKWRWFTREQYLVLRKSRTRSRPCLKGVDNKNKSNKRIRVYCFLWGKRGTKQVCVKCRLGTVNCRSLFCLRKKKTESETKEEILTTTMSRWFIDTRIKANSAALTAVHSGLIFNRYSRYNIISQSQSNNALSLFTRQAH